jgi:stearoyl-CoA desaturase (Delta-9 desaturase)
MGSIPGYKTLANTPYVRLIGFVIVIVPLLGTALAIYLLWERAVYTPDLILMAIMYALTMLGVSAGFHRMLTHHSFRPHPFIKFVLLVLGSMAVEGPALEWAATHIKHHARSDREGDPHSPIEGLFHAHVGWLFKESLADPTIYCRYLLKDAIVLYVSRTFLLWVALSFLIPFLVGGWTGLLWGGLVRIFLVNHVSWSVNSFGHTFGKREFETNDRSHNIWLLALLSFGDSWHNNHHAFPGSAFHGLHWWQIDLAGYVIWVLERLGLAQDVHRASPAMLARYSSRDAGPVPVAPDVEAEAH